MSTPGIPKPPRSASIRPGAAGASALPLPRPTPPPPPPAAAKRSGSSQQPRPSWTPPAAPGYTSPRLQTPLTPSNLGPVEHAPWDDINLTMATPPPVEAYPPPAARDLYAQTSAPQPEPARAQVFHQPYAQQPTYAPPIQQTGWAPSAATDWQAHAPNPDSPLGRTAAKGKKRGVAADPYETETLPIARLRAIKRRGRLGWLIALLMMSILAAVIGLGLEERQRLLDATAKEGEAAAAAEQKVAAAERAAQESASALAAMKADLAAKETTSTEDQKLITDLKGLLSDKEGEIASAGREVSVSLVDDVMFPSGKAELSLVGYRVLARVGKVLKDVEDKQIMIGGHTDDRPVKRGEFATNWELSAARAVNVARYLVEEVGLAPEKVSAAAFSQYRPRSKNAARNRRIEVLLTPVVKVDRQPAK